jgi:hypothetical protein
MCDAYARQGIGILITENLMLSQVRRMHNVCDSKDSAAEILYVVVSVERLTPRRIDERQATSSEVSLLLSRLG